MKKSLIYHIRLLLLCIVAGSIILPSCKKDKPAAAPSISYVRNYAASPNDTILNTVAAGQWVVVVGKNLSGVSQAFFGSTHATINSTFLSDTCIVIQIPSIPFQNMPRDVNGITLVNEGGTANFAISITGTPIISRVRNNEASPKDTVVARLFPGQQINIVGYNLKNATRIAFQGINADLTNAVYTDSSVVVTIPANLSGGDAALVNMISVTTKYGTGGFWIKIIGPPIITSFSYEFPKEGDSVYIHGLNFVSVSNLSFVGTPITSYDVLSDSVIGFTAPALSADGGTVVIETRVGSFTTAYKVNDLTSLYAGFVGLIGNMDWDVTGDYFGWNWNGGSLTSSNPKSGWPSYNADFGVGTGMYVEYKSPTLNGGAGDAGNNIYMNDSHAGWVTPANLTDPGNNWAFKFEINVHNPWNGGTLCIKTNKTDAYIARYEPWKISSSKTAAYTTKGWQTVTIPLSEFRKDDGTAITKVSDLLDVQSGNAGLFVYIHNYSTSATATSFDAAFDNFRVVKR